MEVIDIDGKDGLCLRCHIGLSEEEKRIRLPICTKCIMELMDIVKDDMDIDGIEEFSDDVSDFTDFVSSSARLMGLDDIIIVQVCFNIYMDLVRNIADRKPIMARKIFKDARRFIDIELERLEDSGEDDLNKGGGLGNRDIFEKMMGDIGEMMKGYYNAHGRSDVVDGGDDDVNNRKVDNVPGRDDAEKESGKEGKKETKNGSKRIRVD